MWFHLPYWNLYSISTKLITHTIFRKNNESLCAVNYRVVIDLY